MAPWFTLPDGRVVPGRRGVTSDRGHAHWPRSPRRALSAMRQREIDRRADRRDLRRVALLGRGARAVGVDLGGGLVARLGDAGAQAELLERVLDHARRDHRRADDFAVGVGRRDVGDLRHRRDDRLLERRLRMRAVVDQIEAVGDFARLVRPRRRARPAPGGTRTRRCRWFHADRCAPARERGTAPPAASAPPTPAPGCPRETSGSDRSRRRSSDGCARRPTGSRTARPPG